MCSNAGCPRGGRGASRCPFPCTFSAIVPLGDTHILVGVTRRRIVEPRRGPLLALVVARAGQQDTSCTIFVLFRSLKCLGNDRKLKAIPDPDDYRGFLALVLTLRRDIQLTLGNHTYSWEKRELRKGSPGQ